jgi:predicted ferric reductase
MLTLSKSPQKYGLILTTVLLTLLIWMFSKWYYQDWFANPYKYPAKAASLIATMLMCWAVILSSRWRRLEQYFGGLDKVYQVHKHIGRWAFFIILAHPLFLALHRLPALGRFLGYMWFQDPHGDRYVWGQNLGVAGLLLMAGLIAVTLWIRLPYHIWKKTHEWLGLVLILIVGHIFVVQADVAAYPLLALWLYAWLLAACASFIYIRFLYRFYGPRHEYVLDRQEQIGEILHLTFAPLSTPMDFKPSQFVYLVVNRPGISAEPHPYSIACGYNLAAQFKLGIKQVGDHTRSLTRLKTGDPVSVYGPYGFFSAPFLTAERDCLFIGGGIGITPFLGMWHVALHSEERMPEQDAPWELKRMHPEVIRTWKSPRVSLFYVCREAKEASFDKDIRREVELSHYHGFPAMEKRGHHYELYVSSQQGRITAEIIRDQVAGDIQDKYVFLCGPGPMVDGLVEQFLDLGVPRRQIVVEDFNLV